MKASRLKKGDTIGVVASSEAITDDKIEDIQKSIKLVEELGIDVRFGKYAFQDPTGYGETAKHKAEDINSMFADKKIAGIFCATRGI